MSVIYPGALQRLTSGELNWVTADIKLLLLDHDGDYYPQQDHVFVADIDPAITELDTANYERRTLTGKSISSPGGEWYVDLTANNITYPDLGSSPYPFVGGAIIYEDAPDDENAQLVAFIQSVSGALNGETAVIAWFNGSVIRVRNMYY